MKNIYTIQLLLILLLLSAFKRDDSRWGNIKGIITTSDGKPAESVSVGLKGKDIETITDAAGHYEIKKIKPGNYIIRISGVGVISQEKSITIEDRQELIVNFRLTVNSQQLQEVVISGTQVNKFTREKSEYVSKMPLKNLENPQTYSVITRQLLKDQVITNFDDALKNAPGIDKLWSSTGRAGDGAGYFSLRGFAVQPTLVNGLPGLTNGSLDIANIDRIEVIRGPSGTLFGSSVISYGGLINTVTKKPYETFGGEVAYTAGSFGLNRLTLDINTPVDSGKKLFFRLNGAYHDENSFQDAGFKRTRFIAPSLLYKINPKLTLSLDAQFLAAESTNPTMIFFDRASLLPVHNLQELGYNKKDSYTSNDISIKTPVSTFQAQLNYKISSQWTSRSVLSRGNARSDGYYSYLYGVAQPDPNAAVFRRYISKQNASTNTTDIQQNFIGDFNIGVLRNRIVAGLDYFNQNSIGSNTGYIVNGDVDMNGMETGILSSPHVDSLLAQAPLSNSNLRQEIFSAYASNVLNVTPALSAMFSLRVDHFKNGGITAASGSEYDQTALSPKFGLVYQPVKDRLSLFANYMNGFTNIAPQQQNDGSIKSFKPEQANQLEAGFKTSLFAGRLVSTISYYDIEVTDVVMSVPGQVGFYVQDGTKYSRGFEADITASPVDGLNIITGYSYNENKITKTDLDDYRDRRDEGAGPQHLFNLWASYNFLNGSMKGFGVGFGGNYASKNKILNRATTGVFALPAYKVLNAAVSYTNKAFSIALKLNNITDKDYYKGWSTIEPQMSRNFAANVTYRF